MSVLDDLRASLVWLQSGSGDSVLADMERAQRALTEAQALLLAKNKKIADVKRAIEILEAAEEKPSDG